MYYLIRMIVLLIIYLCFEFIKKKKGIVIMNRSKKTVIISIAAGILVLAIVFIPYEAPFIRFNSAESSVRYFTVNYNGQIKTVETDNTAFCVGHRDNILIP